jgi:hypothetical protein
MDLMTVGGQKPMSRPQELPLAAASIRLRRRPGRPRKLPVEATSGVPRTEHDEKKNASRRSLSHEISTPLLPRLLDLKAAAAYLSMSPWTVREIPADVLPRVRVPLTAGRQLRKLLFDRTDLDRLIAAWKDAAP